MVKEMHLQARWRVPFQNSSGIRATNQPWVFRGNKLVPLHPCSSRRPLRRHWSVQKVGGFLLTPRKIVFGLFFRGLFFHGMFPQRHRGAERKCRVPICDPIANRHRCFAYLRSNFFIDSSKNVSNLFTLRIKTIQDGLLLR